MINQLSSILPKETVNNENDEKQKEALIRFAKYTMPDLTFIDLKSTYGVRMYTFRSNDPVAVVSYKTLRYGNIIDAAVNGNGTTVDQDGNTLQIVIPKRAEEKTKLYIGNALERFEKKKKIPGELECYVGEEADGKMATIQLCTDEAGGTPHVLVAGMSGAGKTVCLNTMILSLLDRYSPEELNLYLLDAKNSFSVYNGVPHVKKTAYRPADIHEAVRDLVHELENRVALFAGEDIVRYNKAHPDAKVPQIVIFFDEVDSCTSIEGGKDEAILELRKNIDLIAEQGRSLGIHLVLASQKPKKANLSTTTKSNLSARVALRVSDKIDEMMVGIKGAFALGGKGDAWVRVDEAKKRTQVAYTSIEDVKKAVEVLKK